MCNRLQYFLLLLIIFPVSLSASAAEKFELSGYYKNILVNSKTLALFPPAKSYTLDLNRLRLQLDGELNDKLSFNIQYDNEILLGNYMQTTQFVTVKNLQSDNYFDLESSYIDNSSSYAKQSIYRAYVALALPDIDIRFGRQRIAWGTAMLWNPMDILNPFNPVQLEREERQGVDAALLDWNYDALSRLSLVYARQRRTSSTAIRWRSNQNGFDFSVMAGRFQNDSIVGFDFSGQIKNIGVKGEITRTDQKNGGSFIRAVIGADYTFDSTLSLNIEAYYNGQGTAELSSYNFNRLFTGKIQSLARRYVGGYFSYDITPLLRWDNYFIFNFDDDSYFIAPGLSYSWSDNMELRGGVQAFKGKPGTEYGTLENLYYLQLQWFF